MKLIQVSLSTNNKRRLVNFYKKVFGCLEVAEWTKEGWGMSAVKLSKGRVLIEVSESRRLVKDSRVFSYHNEGLNMLGFEVEDIKQTIDKTERLGGRLKEKPIKGSTVKYIAFVEDPDGNGIELIQPNLTIKSKYNIEIQDWNREKLWSTGDITPDIDLLHEAAMEGFWNKDIQPEMLQKGVFKIGDISGCPIPNKVAEGRGAANAIKYLYSLSEDFNFIKLLLFQENMSWKDTWGKEERRLRTEPLGENGENVPKGIRDRGIVRGPGNYYEFSITRLLWIDKNEPNTKIRLGKNKVVDIIVNSSSREELQINLIMEMADRRLENDLPINFIVDAVTKGISHEGFFKQNNCYTRVRKSLSLVKDKCSKKKWFKSFESEVNRVLNLPVSKLS